ncbi:hypothetical protein [Azospirillum argentinense]
MEIYSVGFIAVASQKWSLVTGNKDIELYIKNAADKNPPLDKFVLYCRKSLGFQSTSLWRLLKYMKEKTLCSNVLQAFASLYAGHFAIFVEKTDGITTERLVTGFNPQKLLSSFFNTRTLREGGSVPGWWYDDSDMFMDPALRVTSIPVSKQIYEKFKEEIAHLLENKESLFASQNTSRAPLYGWYSLSVEDGRFNCVTAGIRVAEILLRDIHRELDEKKKSGSTVLFNETGLADLDLLVGNMKIFADDLTKRNVGTLTWMYLAMQVGSMLVDDKAEIEYFMERTKKGDGANLKDSKL